MAQPRRANAVDRALVGEADELTTLLAATADLAAVDRPAVRPRLRRVTEGSRRPPSLRRGHCLMMSVF